jgi:hypothetical protein
MPCSTRRRPVKGQKKRTEQPTFPLGRLLFTPTALKAIQDAGQEPAFFLEKQAAGGGDGVAPGRTAAVDHR